jgi:hypothetical protein
MESAEDTSKREPIINTISSARRNYIAAGADLDNDMAEKEYGITSKELKLFLPIECPKLCMTKDGVLRPWTLNICYGKEQAAAMQRLLRKVFWEGGVLLGWKTEPNQIAIFPELLMFPKICLSPSGSSCLEPEASSCLSEKMCFIKSLSKLYAPP